MYLYDTWKNVLIGGNGLTYIVRNYRKEDYKEVTEVMMKTFKKMYAKTFNYEEDLLLEFLQDIQVVPKHQAEGFFVAEFEGRVVGAIVLDWKELRYGFSTERLSLVRKYSNIKLFKAFITYLTMVERPESGECYIENLAVLPEMRHMGISRELLKRAEEFAVDKGFSKMTFYIGGEDHDREKMLKKFGFRMRGVYHSRLHKLVLGEGTVKYLEKVPGKNSSRLTIGMFTDTFMPQINGVATSVYSLANELEKMGHTVYIVTIRDEGVISTFDGKILRIPGVKVLKGTDHRLANILVPRRVNNVIRKMNLDVIHTHTEFSIGLLGTYISKRDFIPHVHTYHTMYDDYVDYVTNFRPFKRIANGFIKTYVKEFTDECQKVFVPTQKTKDVLLDYGVLSDMITIPTGIDFNKFVVDEDDKKVIELKTKLGISEDDFVCMNIGRLSKEKNVDAIVENVKELVSDFPNLKFLVIGDGPHHDALMNKAKGYEKNIMFLGRVPWEEVGYYYRLGHAFVVASRFETQGLTVIEALSSSLPVICPDDEAFVNIVEDGVNGLIFYEDSKIKDKISELMNPEVYDNLVSNAARSVIKYSSEYFAETVVSEYKKMGS